MGLRLDIGFTPYENVIAYPTSFSKTIVEDIIYSAVHVSGYITDSGILEAFASGLQSYFGTHRFFMYYDQQYHDTKFVFSEPWSIDNVVLDSGGNSFSYDLVKAQSFADVLQYDSYLTRETTYAYSGTPETGVIYGMSGVWQSMRIYEIDGVEIFGRIDTQIDYDFLEDSSSGTTSVNRYYEPTYGYLITNSNRDFVTTKNLTYFPPTTGVLYDTGVFERNWSIGPYDVDWSGALTKNADSLSISTSTADESWATFMTGPLDLTDWSQLRIEWSHYTDIPLGGRAFLAIDPSGSTGYDDYLSFTEVNANDTSPSGGIDVSAVSGYHYIFYGLYTTGKPTTLYTIGTKVELI